jgi:hypothetical protein
VSGQLHALASLPLGKSPRYTNNNKFESNHSIFLAVTIYGLLIVTFNSDISVHVYYMGEVSYHLFPLAMTFNTCKYSSVTYSHALTSLAIFSRFHLAIRSRQRFLSDGDTNEQAMESSEQQLG